MTTSPVPEEDELDAGHLLARAYAGGEGPDPDMLLRDGSSLRLHLGRWLREPPPDEQHLLARARGPVLDIGCGPGRHVAWLRGRGVDALGLDVLPEAVAQTRRRGGRAQLGSIFEEVPRGAVWGSALLLDGNIGISGDPVALLRRIADDVLHDEGTVLLEASTPGTGITSFDARITHGEVRSARFRWARVGVDRLDELAAETGFVVAERWPAGERWFAELVRA